MEGDEHGHPGYAIGTFLLGLIVIAGFVDGEVPGATRVLMVVIGFPLLLLCMDRFDKPRRRTSRGGSR